MNPPVRFVPWLRLLCAAFLAGSTLVASDRPVLEAARLADARLLRRALRPPVPADVVNQEDSRGFTALFYATRFLSIQEMKILLDRGADANHRTKDNVTAFTFAVTDVAKARLLLDRGFDFRRTPAGADTSLMVAARHPQGFEVVRLLVERGADVNARGSNDIPALVRALYSSDPRTVRLLLDAGADVNQVHRYTDGTVGQPFVDSLYTSSPQIIRLLLERKPDLDFSDTFSGNSLSAALLNGVTNIVPDLLRGGVDTKAVKNIGEVPAILFAAHNERGDPAMVKLLLEHGADIDARNDRGETALTWAKKRGDTELVRYLQARGAQEGGVTRSPEIPRRAVTFTPANRQELVREAVQRSVAILQTGCQGFLDRDNRPEQCISCHHQTFPGIAFGWAGQLGVPLDRAGLERQIREQVKFWSGRVGPAFNYDDPVGGAVENLGYGFLNFAQNRHAPDDVTEAMTHYLAAVQRRDGSWDGFRGRPPAESTPMSATALAVRSLQLYPTREPRSRIAQRLEHARKYLLSQNAFTTEERSFQLLGLSWAGAGRRELEPRIAALRSAQRSDGGWGQIPTLASDAYATGEALTVLLTCGGLSVDDPRYARGAEFLLRTQFPDGSWYVKTRTWPFQTHFSTGFPFGRDQWVSASATTWATLALLHTLDPGGPVALRSPPARLARRSTP